MPVLVKVPVLAVCLLLGALGVAPVQSADWDAVTPPDMGKMFSDPVYVQSMANALSAARQAEAERATLSEQAAREDSETAYAEVSSAQAHDLAQQQFPSLMTEGLDELGLPRGVRVKDFLAPNVAQLVNSEGKMSLLVGSEELATKDGSGELEQVDLSLRSEGGDYVPVEPAVDLTIPHQADEYLTLEQTGLGVRPADAPATSGLREDDRVFYPEVGKDTDFISMPTRSGAEVMWQLRSADAAESLALDLDLPEGASARLISGLTAPLGRTADPASVGVEIVRDGTVLDTIAAPTAFDADGVEVPASYRLDGDRVIVDVAHRAADVKYPIAVDPEVHEVWGGVDYNANCNTPGAGNWHYQTFVTALGAYCTNGTPGLYVQSDPGVYYGQNAAGQWWWGTPASVHIISGWLDGLYHVPQASNFYDGIYQASHGWETVHNYPGGMQNAQDSLQAVGWDENFVVFGMTMLGVGARGGYGLAAIRGANIRIGDSWSPQYVRLNNFYINGVNTGLQSTWAGNQATPWLNGYESLAAQVSALDTGLGIYHVGIDQTSGGDYLYHHLANCTGNRAAPCSLGALETGALNFGQLKGIITLRTFASDITDNLIHGPQWVARIDRDNPKITVSGETVDHAQDGTLGPNPKLHVSVTDGDVNGPISGYQSGVRKVVVQVDGGVLHTWTNSLPDTTNNNFSWEYALPTTTNGTHTVRVTAWDDAGNPPGTYNLSYVQRNNTSWTYGGANHEIDLPAEMETVGALLTGPSYQTIWNELTKSDKDGMMAGWDSHFRAWAPRFDQQPPVAPGSIAIDSTHPSQHTAVVSWSAGSDPDLASGIQGSGPDLERADYRFRRSGGSFSNWASSDNSSATITSVDTGDAFDIDVRGYDAAGNVSAYTRQTFTVPPVTANAALVWLAPLACVGGGCEAILGVGAGVGAVATGWIIADNVHWDVKKVANSKDVPLDAGGSTPPGIVNGETQAEWQARGIAERNDLRDKVGAKKGEHAHHIVPVKDSRAAELRDILFKCGIDLNDKDNGVALTPQQHFPTYGRPYFNALEKLLHRHDPDASISPCDEFRDDPVHGLRATLKKIQQYLLNGTFPY